MFIVTVVAKDSPDIARRGLEVKPRIAPKPVHSTDNQYTDSQKGMSATEPIIRMHQAVSDKFDVAFQQVFIFFGFKGSSG